MARRIEELIPDGIGISVVSMGELYEGVYSVSDPASHERDLRVILSEIVVVDIDDETCRIFGQERGRLRTANNLIGDTDLWIGATAMRHGLTLLTNNRRHFQRMQGLSVVSV